jgi:hypothetical protein
MEFLFEVSNLHISVTIQNIENQLRDALDVLQDIR